MRELTVMVDGGIPRVRIALTAFAAERERQQSAEAGFQRHIARPVDPAMLVATIHALLQSGVPQA